MTIDAERVPVALAPSPFESQAEDGPDAAPSPRSAAWSRLRGDPFFWVGAGLASLVIAVSLLAPLLAPHDPAFPYRELMGSDRILPPSAMFPLGTDTEGRDYLSRLLFAGRPTLIVGLGATFIATAIGLLVGCVAGYVRTARVPLPLGRTIRIPVETVLMRLTDIGLAFPVLLLAIAATSVLGQSLMLVVVVIASVLWTTTARLVHGQVGVLRSADFVLAAQATGCTSAHILRRHVLPQVLPLALVYGALGIAGTILFEAALSYVGAGSPSDDPTWGHMIQEAVGEFRTDLRLPLLPGLAIMVTVLAFTLLGDALRDAADPRGGSR